MKFLQEPLLHFLCIGAALFLAHGLLNREPERGPQDINVSAGQIENLASIFAKTWQRPPTTDELKGLIDQLVKEEILSREAVKLGLDQNDLVIRRRLQQKMEFVTEDLLATAEPTDTDLGDYLARNPNIFRQDHRYTFRQVFLSHDKRGDRIEADATHILAALKAGGDAEEAGDPTLLPASIHDASQTVVANNFGRDFATALSGAAIGEWTGPLASGYGLHLVLIESKQQGHVPALSEIRGAVQREWENDRRTEASRRFMEELLKQYRVIVEWPQSEPITPVR